MTAISAAADVSGGLTLLMNGTTMAIWDHDSGTNRILYGTTAATNLLAANITELNFVGLKADGTSATTQTDLIHAVKCTIKHTVTRPTGPVTETLSSTAWLRA